MTEPHVSPLKLEAVDLEIDNHERSFDISDPELPSWIKSNALSAGGYPYEEKIPGKIYKKELESLQIELVKLQYWLQETGERIIAIFEGRDTAGKGGCITRVRSHLNPRIARNVALPKPNEVERGQWYFQRYIAHFPTSGEFLTFDRSWYNRGIVEPVMGFCTPEQQQSFLDAVPDFERAIVNDGIHFFKFWLNIGQETQLKRFHERYHDPLKRWKFSDVDMKGISKWDDYTRARDVTISRTHTRHGPWTIVLANDQRRARLSVIRHMLLAIPYAGRDLKAIGAEDAKLVGSGPAFLR